MKTLEASPPRARRHTHTARTTDAELRILLGKNQHDKSIHGRLGFGNSTWWAMAGGGEEEEGKDCNWPQKSGSWTAALQEVLRPTRPRRSMRIRPVRNTFCTENRRASVPYANATSSNPVSVRAANVLELTLDVR